MVKHTQTICCNLSANCLSVFDLFVGLALEGLSLNKKVTRLIPANKYMLKVNIRNTRKKGKICSKLIIKTQEQDHWRHSGIFIVNFWTCFIPFSSISIVVFWTGKCLLDMNLKQKAHFLWANNACLKSTNRSTSVDVILVSSHLTFTCSKSTIEALEKVAKYVQS